MSSPAPDLLAAMASGAREVPDEVEADPKAQMQFLDKEIPLDKGLFYPSLLEELLPVFQQYVFPETRFLDLGSGDGRALFLANVLGSLWVGLGWSVGSLGEFYPELIDMALAHPIAFRAGLATTLRDPVELAAAVVETADECPNGVVGRVQ